MIGSSPNHSGPNINCTLITPLKNERDNVEQLWSAIQNQTVQPSEWIITDNGSTDGTYEWLLEHAPYSPFPVRVLSLPGYTIAKMMNAAIRSTKHDIIACCHGGTKIPKDWLENLLRPFQEDQTVEVSAGVWEPYGETSFERWVASTMQVDINKLDENRYLPASRSLAFKRSAWEKVGGFPEWLPRFGEDTLFAIRLRSAGCKFVIARGAKVGWRPKSSLSSFIKQAFFYIEANATMGLPRVFSCLSALRRWGIILLFSIGIWRFPLLAISVILIMLDILRERLRKQRKFGLSAYILQSWLLGFVRDFGFVMGALPRWFGILKVPLEDKRAITIFFSGADVRKYLDDDKAEMSNGRILLMANTPWGSQRPYHLAQGLSSLGWRVDYLQLVIGLSHAIRRCDPFAVFRPVRVQLSNQLYLISSAASANLARTITGSTDYNKWGDAVRRTLLTSKYPTRVYALLYQLWSQWMIWYTIKSSNYDILILTSPNQYPVIQVMKKQKHADRKRLVLIFDFMDDFSKMSEFGWSYLPTERMQSITVKGCDLVVAVTKSLKERAESYGTPAILIPNGVDIDRFLTERDPYPILCCLPRPIIGFLGTLGSWIDQDLLYAVAETFPNASIAIVGRVLSKSPKLALLPNVHFIDPVPYAEVPAVLSAFDICLSPFDIEQLITPAVSPLKVYEYLASGKPVVSTYMPDIERVADVVYISYDKSQFVNLVRQALTEDNAELKMRRVEAARRNSWSNMCQKYSDVLSTLITQCR